MSLRALALATRNALRENLTNFYDVNTEGLSAAEAAAALATQTRRREANCRVMPGPHPPPNSGQEFIAIYGAAHRPNSQPLVAIDERLDLTIAVTLRCGNIPRDHRGEVGYINDEEVYTAGWKTVEERCREIVGLVHMQYTLLRDANLLVGRDLGFTEPLVWLGTDAVPQEVDGSFFCAWHGGTPPAPPLPESDTTYGLVMKVQFGSAVTFQPQHQYDVLTPSSMN